MGTTLATVLVSVGVASVANAHPVAQGALLARVDPTVLRLTATISAEEILVGTLALAHGNQAEADRIRRYGEYLLQHIYINADGRRLEGRMTRTPGELRERSEFRLEYSFANSKPRELQFNQNALREFLFAPGNPWEAQYLLKLDTPDEESGPVLLTSDTTISVDCAWKASSDCIIRSANKNLGNAFVFEGIRHILTGYDHLLFVGALLLAVGGLWELVKVVAVFTVAHTVTLSLATFGFLRLSPGLIEPVIAASIVAVALQNIVLPRQSRGAARLAVAFAFGLFHGLGYARGLSDAMATLSVGNVLWSLAAFSLGVEIGHQMVLLPMFAGLHVVRRYLTGIHVDTVVVQTGSGLIGAAGLFYFVRAFVE